MSATSELVNVGSHAEEASSGSRLLAISRTAKFVIQIVSAELSRILITINLNLHIYITILMVIALLGCRSKIVSNNKVAKNKIWNMGGET